MIVPHRVLGEALTGRVQEFGRHSEVTLGRSDIEVPEEVLAKFIGREEFPIFLLGGMAGF